MKSIAFMSQKGGTGKSTLAVHMAVAAKETGEGVAIIDTDIQASATVWGKARNNNAPIVVTTAAAELQDVLKAARHDAMTLCIIDTAPHAAPDATRVAAAVDLVVIPCRPTALDLAAVASAFEIITAAKKRGVFVLSACPTRAPEIEETRSVLSQYGLPIAPGQITERRAFARAVATGRAVTEFESSGKAAEEIRQLWQWLRKQP